MVEMNVTPAAALERHRALTSLPLSLNNARELGGIGRICAGCARNTACR